MGSDGGGGVSEEGTEIESQSACVCVCVCGREREAVSRFVSLNMKWPHCESLFNATLQKIRMD